MPNESNQALICWPMAKDCPSHPAYGRVRFWVYINGDYARLTLSPGQSLHHYQGWETDEGWDSETHFWSHDHDRIRLYWVSDGRDCDGRLSQSSTCECSLDRLNAYQVEDPDRPAAPPRLPEWQQTSSAQRDYSAEAAGY